MKKLIVLLTLIHQLTFAQTSLPFPSSNTVADASVAETDQYSAFQNPATVGAIQNIEVGFGYENKFLLNELSVKSINIVIPTRLINIGASGSYMGYNMYNELIAGIALSRSFGSIFQIGLQANYYSVYFAEVNKRFAVFIPQFGVQVNLSPSVNIGFSTFNPSQQILKTESTKSAIPSIFSIGAKWKINKDLRVLSQIDKNMTAGYRIASGFEYNMKDILTIRTGAYHHQYLIPTIGFGCIIRNLRLNLNAELHPILGLNSRASINYTFAKR